MRRKKHLERRIALERIDTLFQLAEKEALKGNWNRTNRYVELARIIGKRHNVSVGPPHRQRFCRSCHTFLLPPVTARVRMRQGRIVYTCIKCGRVMRFPYLREKRDIIRKG